MSLQWSIHRATLDPVAGSEQAGTRPVLIVSREAINRALPIVGVLPITTFKARRPIYPTEVLLPKGTAGLPADSLVMAHQIRTIAVSRLVKQYGVLEDHQLRRQVTDSMRIFLDLEA